MGLPSQFDHEELDIYRLELKFLAWVTQFLADPCGASLAGSRELRDQLDRASLSMLLNTAEGNGRRQGQFELLRQRRNRTQPRVSAAEPWVIRINWDPL